MDFEKNKNIEYIGNFFNDRSNIKKIKIPASDNRFPMQKNRVVEGIRKLCFLWNESEKTRIFVIKLLRSFFPLQTNQKVLEFSDNDKNIDVLLNNKEFDNPKGYKLGKFVRLAGLEEITEFVSKFTKSLEYSNEKAIEQREHEDYQSFEIREDNIRDWVMSLPYEIQHADFAYYNNSNNYFICRESAFAMRKFIEYCLQFDIPEIKAFCLRKERDAEEKLSKTIGATLGPDLLQKFKKMGTL